MACDCVRYRHMLTWSDGSMGYFRHIRPTKRTGQYFYILQEDFDVDEGVFPATVGDHNPDIYLPDPADVSLFDIEASDFLLGLEFFSHHPEQEEPENVFRILCEFDTLKTGLSSLLGVTLTPPTKRFPSPMVACPEGHMTHSFLACDVKSACWARGYGEAYTCGAPLTPLPPSFTCDSEVERVPYTAVCDHRADCGDGSDEDFCVFPVCQGGANMECALRQVIFFFFFFFFFFFTASLA